MHPTQESTKRAVGVATRCEYNICLLMLMHPSGLLDGDCVLDEVDARGLERAEERALDLHVLGLIWFSM